MICPHDSPIQLLDPGRLQAVVARHGLLEQWRRFGQQFLGDTP
jgi:hypothetical protein